jgi:hypothetical protein
VDTQQECEYAAARVEALQTKSALTAEPAGGSADEVAAEEQRDAAQPLPTDACHQCRNDTAAEEKEVLPMEEEPLYANMDGNPWVPGPNIYLASLVDQRNYRSYCLDLAGSPPHPQCNSVQGHTCKTEGEDTQWKYETDRHQIRAANFNAGCNPTYSGAKNGREWQADTRLNPGCLTVSGHFTAGATMSLTACSTGKNTRQTFMHTNEGQFRVADTRFCLVLGKDATVFDGEDFYIRSLELQDCGRWPENLSQWEVLLPDHSRVGWTNNPAFNTSESDSSQTE